MSQYLILSSFFGLEAGQLQGLRAYGGQTNTIGFKRRKSEGKFLSSVYP